MRAYSIIAFMQAAATGSFIAQPFGCAFLLVVFVPENGGQFDTEVWYESIICITLRIWY